MLGVLPLARRRTELAIASGKASGDGASWTDFANVAAAAAKEEAPSAGCGAHGVPMGDRPQKRVPGSPVAVFFFPCTLPQKPATVTEKSSNLAI